MHAASPSLKFRSDRFHAVFCMVGIILQTEPPGYCDVTAIFSAGHDIDVLQPFARLGVLQNNIS